MLTEKKNPPSEDVQYALWYARVYFSASTPSFAKEVFGLHTGNGNDIENQLHQVWQWDQHLRALFGNTKGNGIDMKQVSKTMMRVGGSGHSVTSQPDYGHGGEESVLNKQVSDYTVSNYESG